jgi:Cu-Zn family superoxide dismutase
MKKRVVLFSAFLLGWYAGDPAGAQDSVKTTIINSDRQEVGEATLTDTPKGVIITLKLKEKAPGIPPGERAFHIHAVGKCEPPAFKSAGDHYNPEKKQHGFLSKDGGHAGDLPNIHVPENGPLATELLVPGVRLKAGKNRLLDEDGAALVIHAQKDDYRSDPAGNAGDRIACGVIQGPSRSK